MFPFLSIGNIFSFSGGACKKKNKGKRTKKRLQSNKKINKTSKDKERKMKIQEKIVYYFQSFLQYQKLYQNLLNQI